MTVKELLELLNIYSAQLPDAQVVNDGHFSYDSVWIDRDENGDTVVVID